MDKFTINKVSFLPYLRTNKGGKIDDSTVYITVSCNGTKHSLNTGIKGCSEHWNTQRKEFKGVQYQERNRKLWQIVKELEGIEYDLSHENQSLTANDIANKYNGKISKKTIVIEVVPSFLKVLDMYLERKELHGRKHQTVKNHNVLKRHLTQFLSHNKGLKCDDFDLSLADDFEVYMLKKGIRKNHIGRALGLAKKVIEFAITKKLATKNELQRFSIKFEERINTQSLEREMIEKVLSLEYSPRLQKIADIFVFMCGTGIDHCDYIRLENTNYNIEQGRHFIGQERQKTGTKAEAVLLPFAVDIVRKYKGIENLPRCSLTELNRGLKEIAKNADIKIRLTSKIARKTYTNYLLNELKLSSETAAFSLGHKNTKTLKHYANAGLKRVLGELESINFEQG